MLFGKREEQVDVGSDRLEEYLRDLFERDTERVVSQGATSLQKLQRGLDMFSHAIDILSSHTGSPDEEYIGRTSVGVASDQKRSYEMALRNALAALREELDVNTDDTGYEKLQRRKLSCESFISKLLTTNSNFKLVVLGYSSQMGAFKKAFSAIEKGVKDFGTVLERGSEQLKRYDALNSHIAKFRMLREELSAISERTSGTDAADAHRREKESASAAASSAEAKKTELGRKMSSLAEHADRLSGDLGSLLLPIERASRKYDHDSKKGTLLSDYITDTYSKSWDETESAEFHSLLKGLRKSVLEGKIEVKNRESIASHIDLIMDSRIADTINEIKALRSEQESVRNELRACEDEIGALRNRESESDSAMAERSRMIENKSKLEEEMNSEGLTISKLFLEYYRKQIRIV